MTKTSTELGKAFSCEAGLGVFSHQYGLSLQFSMRASDDMKTVPLVNTDDLLTPCLQLFLQA